MKKEDKENLEQAARILKVVAHPVRLEIVGLLRKNKKISVGEIQRNLAVTQSMTSQHLAALKNVGLVASLKEGNVCYYFLTNRNILKLLDCVSNCQCPG